MGSLTNQTAPQHTSSTVPRKALHLNTSSPPVRIACPSMAPPRNAKDRIPDPCRASCCLLVSGLGISVTFGPCGPSWGMQGICDCHSRSDASARKTQSTLSNDAEAHPRFMLRTIRPNSARLLLQLVLQASRANHSTTNLRPAHLQHLSHSSRPARLPHRGPRPSLP